MRKINIIEPKVPQMPSRKMVAAYARVSMESERLQHSLSAQVSYYSSLIQQNPAWEYAGVYADDGIACIHITAPFHLSIHFFDGHTFEAQWENKRKMPKHSEERKQHMREVMIQKWRERHGESNDHSGDDQPVYGSAD